MRTLRAAALLVSVAALFLVSVAMADVPEIPAFTETVIEPTGALPDSTIAPAPFNFEFSGEDALRLTVHNSQPGVVVAVHYRMFRPGASSHANTASLAPTSDRAATVQEFTIGQGFLRNVTVYASAGTPRRGQTFVRLQVIRGRGAAAVVLGTIVQGYVTGALDLAWPGSPIQSSLEGDGYTRLVTGTDPAANTESAETVPTGARWELVNYSIALVTDANIDSRRVNLIVDDGSVDYFYSAAPLQQPASNSFSYFWSQGAVFTTNVTGGVALAFLPHGFKLLAGHRVKASITNRYAGDNLGAPRLLVTEWLEV